MGRFYLLPLQGHKEWGSPPWHASKWDGLAGETHLCSPKLNPYLSFPLHQSDSLLALNSHGRGSKMESHVVLTTLNFWVVRCCGWDFLQDGGNYDCMLGKALCQPWRRKWLIMPVVGILSSWRPNGYDCCGGVTPNLAPIIYTMFLLMSVSSLVGALPGGRGSGSLIWPCPWNCLLQTWRRSLCLAYTTRQSPRVATGIWEPERIVGGQSHHNCPLLQPILEICWGVFSQLPECLPPP